MTSCSNLLSVETYLNGFLRLQYKLRNEYTIRLLHFSRLLLLLHSNLFFDFHFVWRVQFVRSSEILTHARVMINEEDGKRFLQGFKRS